VLTIHQNSTGIVNNMKIKAADDSPQGNQTEKEDESKVSMGGAEPSGSGSSMARWFRLHMAISEAIHTAVGTWVRKKM